MKWQNIRFQKITCFGTVRCKTFKGVNIKLFSQLIWLTHIYWSCIFNVVTFCLVCSIIESVCALHKNAEYYACVIYAHKQPTHQWFDVRCFIVAILKRFNFWDVGKYVCHMCICVCIIPGVFPCLTLSILIIFDGRENDFSQNIYFSTSLRT